MIADADHEGNLERLKRFDLHANEVVPRAPRIGLHVPGIQSAVRIQLSGVVLVHFVDRTEIA